MKKIIVIVTILIAAFISQGCTNTIDKKVNIQTAKADLDKIKNENKKDYTEEDFKGAEDALAGGLFLALMQGEKKVDKTYKEVLDGVKNERLRKELLFAEYNKKITEMRKLLSVKVTNKEFSKAEYSIMNQVVLSFEIVNNSGKDISGLNGTVDVQDMFGKSLIVVSLKETGGLKDKQSIKPTYYYNPGITSDEHALETNAFDKLKFIWYPSEYIFNDGTSIKAPEKPE